MIAGRKRKGKDSIQNKKDKTKGKIAFKEAISDPNKKKSNCPSCGATDHFSPRSRLCTNHKESLKDISIRIAGSKREEFTRRIPFSSIVNQQYHDELQQKICELSKHLREVIIRVQLFVNDFILANHSGPINQHVFSQNFFYSTAQLVLGKPVTNNSNYPEAVLAHWRYFQTEYELPDIIPIKGYSDALSYACKTLETTYINFYVENFHRIFTNFALYVLNHHTVIIIEQASKSNENFVYLLYLLLSSGFSRSSEKTNC